MGLQQKLEGNTVYLSAITLGELRYGAYKSAKTADNLKRIAAFILDYNTLSCDEAAATAYGLIKVGLSIKGRPIPDNDIWIAAVARQYGLILVSRDEHFKEIDGLSWEKW